MFSLSLLLLFFSSLFFLSLLRIVFKDAFSASAAVIYGFL